MKKIASLIPIIFIIILFNSGCKKDDSIIGKPNSPREINLSTYKLNTQINISGENNITINGDSIIAGNKPAITLSNCTNVTIENCRLLNGTTVTSVGVYLYKCANITVKNNFITNVASGVYTQECTGGIIVTNNQMQNMLGPLPRGQFVQFNNASGSGNAITNNKLENILGSSYPEDAINLYESNGTSTSPITVSGNWIRGGGPSKTGGGICMGDAGGSFQTVENNILVNPGQYGIGIASGTDMIMSGNEIYAAKNTFTNIGIDVWNQYTTSCSIITVESNLVNYTNSSGVNNGFWNDGNCGNVVGLSTNNFDDAAITASILPAVIISDK